jgi:23S rRNA (uridine2552-2'-O)-methyltransferase
MQNIRNKFTKVRTAKGRKISSTNWLQRQLNDPFVAQARASGYRSRAAFKLLEIQDKFHLFKPGQYVIDLGAAPGGWSQIAAELIKSKSDKPRIVGIDLLEMDAIPGAISMQKNFYDADIEEVIAAALGTEKVDIVMSDMAANTTGHARTDHLRIMDLCHHSFNFACKFLKPGGCFIAKIFQGGAEKEVLEEIKRAFLEIKHFKPKSSRQDSAEMYLVAKGFR